jgi:molecular chaperone GrpE (heat shock protein)
LTDALADASWAEADRALAEALADFEELASARNPKRRRELFEMLGQSLNRAARKRGLSRMGAVGEQAEYDPEIHELVSARGRKAGAVEIVARGAMRGGEVLAKARVRKPR